MPPIKANRHHLTSPSCRNPQIKRSSSRCSFVVKSRHSAPRRGGCGALNRPAQQEQKVNNCTGERPGVNDNRRHARRGIPTAAPSAMPGSQVGNVFLFSLADSPQTHHSCRRIERRLIAATGGGRARTGVPDKGAIDIHHDVRRIGQGGIRQELPFQQVESGPRGIRYLGTSRRGKRWRRRDGEGDTALGNADQHLREV